MGLLHNYMGCDTEYTIVLPTFAVPPAPHHEQAVKVVGDAAGILDVGNHVAHGGPVGLGGTPRVHVADVRLAECKGKGKWRGEELLNKLRCIRLATLQERGH